MCLWGGLRVELVKTQTNKQLQSKQQSVWAFSSTQLSTHMMNGGVSKIVSFCSNSCTLGDLESALSRLLYSYHMARCIYYHHTVRMLTVNKTSIFDIAHIPMLNCLSGLMPPYNEYNTNACKQHTEFIADEWRFDHYSQFYKHFMNRWLNIVNWIKEKTIINFKWQINTHSLSHVTQNVMKLMCLVFISDQRSEIIQQSIPSQIVSAADHRFFHFC